ncbi:hypothetical protein OH77DRAFT_1395596 [Trametes cingulata]|nr:hypothetical protein OH77DRAFT_1395596 [Trametes cingulata]
MASRPRLAVSDILHRSLVWSLFGISVWGIVMIGVVHHNTMKAGRGACVSYRPVLQLWWTIKHSNSTQDEQNEIALAEAAQAALKGRSKPS